MYEHYVYIPRGQHGQLAKYWVGLLVTTLWKLYVGRLLTMTTGVTWEMMVGGTVMFCHIF